MESIRVRNKDVYTIEVNDNGDTIEFDMTDISLPFALERASRMVEDAQRWFKAQQVIIQKKQDTVKKGDILSTREKALLEVYKEMFTRIRAAVDEFAGEGASQKIFGNKNYINMFNDFMDAMKPHFDNMQLNAVATRQRIEEKYGASVSDDL